MHYVNWSTVTLPKCLGGLGLRDLEAMDKACLLKLCWSLHGDNNLWTAVLNGKYGRRCLPHGPLLAKNTDSHLWRHLVQLWKILSPIELWSVGNGESIKAWSDCWIAPGLILNNLGVVPSSLDGLMVRDLTTNDGEWNYEVLGAFLPPQIMQKFLSLLPPNTENGKDVVLWGATSNGSFTVSSAYLVVKGLHPLSQCTRWSNI